MLKHLSLPSQLVVKIPLNTGQTLSINISHAEHMGNKATMRIDTPLCLPEIEARDA